MDLYLPPFLESTKQFLCSVCLPCGVSNVGTHKVRIGNKFAEGGFSSVFRCVNIKTGEKYALKQMIASEAEQVDHISKEIEMHQRFQHPNLLRLLDYSKENVDGKITYRLLFPLYESGSVGDVITRMRDVGKIFSEQHALHLFAQVLSGLSIMHTATPPIAHHDIKPENVLLAGTDTAVLMDFGSACCVRYIVLPFVL